MTKHFLALLGVSSALFAAQPASAAITWADWQQSTTNQVTGVAGPVGVTYSGTYGFAQLTPGTDWYTGAAFPPAYKPTNTDIIGLSSGGPKTLSFSQPVSDIYLAIVSWNGQVATFDQPVSIITQGCGYWGCGTGSLSNGDLTLTASGELHGVLHFTGPLTSLSFTDRSEYWHGITVGFGSLAPAVPEPASWALMIGGFALAGAALRRRKPVAVTSA